MMPPCHSCNEIEAAFGVGDSVHFTPLGLSLKVGSADAGIVQARKRQIANIVFCDFPPGIRSKSFTSLVMVHGTVNGCGKLVNWRVAPSSISTTH